MSDSMWNLSKRSFLVDFWLLPLLLILATPLSLDVGLASYCALAAVGYALWSISEYWIHRSVYHRIYRRAHWQHHINPSKWIGVPPLLSCLFIIGMLIAICRLIDVPHGAVIWSGFVIGYYHYIVVHTMIHHTSTKLFAKMRKAHDYHHLGSEENFGVTTTFWDKVFRTYHAV